MGRIADADRPWLDQVLAAKSGDREAFAALVERFRGAVVALAYSYLRDPDEAEDVAQEAFVRAFAGLGKLEDPKRFTSWLNGITAHAAVDRLRERQLLSRLPADPWKVARSASKDDPAEAAQKRENAARLSEALEDALGEISEDCRRAAILRFFAGMSYAEIAEFTSVPPSTVRGQLYRATRHLRERLRTLLGG